jgi:RHS repeat-associated protein
MQHRILGFTAIVLVSLCATLAQAATDWSAQDYDLYPGDFDGDGKTDVLYVAKDSAKASGIAKSDSSGAPNTPWQSWPSNFLGIPWNANQYVVHIADFSGDGRADIFMQRTSAGDHFLLISDPNGKVTAIYQVVSNSHLGLVWSADQHKIIAGDFSGDGKADLFLQATSPAGMNAAVIADANGQFNTASQNSWTYATWGAFKWSTQNSNIFAGDFDGDGDSDLLIQAKPKIVMIDYEIPIPVPTYEPNSFGVVRSQGGTQPFSQSGVEQWSRYANGVDWSSNAANVVIGNFDGTGGADVLLQARSSSRPSYLLTGNAVGSAFSSGAAVTANVTFAADGARLIAANFDGTGGVGIYVQTITPGGTNYIANAVGTSITASAHSPVGATGIVPATAVGHTVGSFAVSSQGAATYSIPIVVPPGVAGMQPALSIGYQSGSGNGPLGIGWGLGGLSEIERCSKTLAQDNSSDSVNLTLADRFCLDGNKLRLTGGVYGQAGSTYQTEMETFARVTAYGNAGNGPAYFIVEGKNGLKYEYGNSTDSRIEAVNATNNTTAHTWALNKVSDRNGNAMTIAYQEDAAPNGSFRPLTISYTSNTAAGLTAAYRVEFSWVARSTDDILSMYVAGGLVKETYRLNAIETKYYEASNWRLVRKYQLTYNTSGSTPRTRLGAIQECDRDGNCLAPTMVSWQEGLSGWEGVGTETLTNSAATAKLDFFQALDLNGDGRSDLVYPAGSTSYTWHFMLANASGGYDTSVATSIAAGSSSNPVYAFALPIDFSSDGRRDLLVSVPGTANLQVMSLNGATLTLTNAGPTLTLSGRQWVSDFDGDGREDLLNATSSSNTVTFNVHKNIGGALAAASPFYSIPLWPGDVVADFTWGSAGPGNTPDKVADFNGDGRGDFLYRKQTMECWWDELQQANVCSYPLHWHALLSTGTSFVPTGQPMECSWLGSCRALPLLGDINSDGFSDLVYEGGGNWVIGYGTGAGISDSLVDSGVPAGTTPAHAFLADYDTDGRADLVYAPPSGSNWMVLRSTGTGFAAAVPTAIPASSFSDASVRPLDMDGDGLLDVGYSLGTYRIRKHRGTIPDLMSSITDGFGNSVSITYAPLTNSSVYTKGTAATFPQVDFQGSLYVVKQHSASDGIGGTYITTEKYSGARADLQGRGFLGYAGRESIDSRSGVKSTWTFRQDYPYIGFASVVSTYQSSGGPLISQVTNTYAELMQGGSYNDRHFPYLHQSVQDSHEVGNGNGAIARVTTTTSLDSYGNPTNVTTTTADQTGSTLSYTSQTTNTYGLGYDTTNWCLGFVTQQTVTNTVPGWPSQTRTVQYTKDTPNPAKCRVHQEIVEPNDIAVTVTTTIGYDTFGHPNSQTVSAANIASRTTTTSYGPQGVFPTSITTQLSTGNQTAEKTYDYALGVPLTAKDLNQLTVSWSYDGFGRLMKETRPDQTKTAWTYSSCSVANNYCGDSRLRYQVQKQELDTTNPGNVIRSSTQMFDAFGRSLYDQAQTLSGAMSTVRINYDNQGRVQQRSQPFIAGSPVYYTSFTYDLIGRPSVETRQISEAVTGTQSTTYGYNKLTHTQTDANGKITTKIYNAIGQVAEMIDAIGGITKYQYDPFGNLKKTIDPANNEIVNTFNIRGFKLSTSDPDMGMGTDNWEYTYYPTGELRTQTNAKNQVVTFTYDELSRPLTRVEPEGTTTFVYGVSQAAKDIGKLASVSSPGSYSETYTYDTVGRLESTTTNADATSFVISNSYNSATGLLETTTYPTSTSAVAGSRFKVQYEYANGLLKRTRDFNAPGTVYWEQVATDAAGATIDEQYGNGLHTYSTYDAITGLLASRTSGATSQVQNLTYQWDKVGNLTQRKDAIQNLTEDFYYDKPDGSHNLYRLDRSTLKVGTSAPVANLSLTYDSIGNIKSKSDVGTYTYPMSGAGVVRPHAVTAAGAKSYAYDANGNMITRNGDAITWYSYNLPDRINQGSNYSQFYYGAGRGRYKQVAYTSPGGSLPSGTETTLYIGGLFEKVTKPSGVIEYKHYIMAGKEAVAIRTLRSNSANDTRYLHKDHLGSVDSITNESGAVVQRLSFDAFGKRRSASSWSGSLTSGDWTSIAAITHRGFTFHEQLDNVELVHMNGRVYDPLIGRFISADPFIQAPLMSQSLNRYSYVMNNPLSITDPSGYSWVSKWVKKQWNSFRRDLNSVVGAVLIIVGTVIPALQFLVPIGYGIMVSPVRVIRGPDGMYVSYGYGFGGDSRGGPAISAGSGSPPPMTAPAGAVSLQATSNADSYSFEWLKAARGGPLVLSPSDPSYSIAKDLDVALVEVFRTARAMAGSSDPFTRRQGQEIVDVMRGSEFIWDARDVKGNPIYRCDSSKAAACTSGEDRVTNFYDNPNIRSVLEGKALRDRRQDIPLDAFLTAAHEIGHLTDYNVGLVRAGRLEEAEQDADRWMFSLWWLKQH